MLFDYSSIVMSKRGKGCTTNQRKVLTTGICVIIRGLFLIPAGFDTVQGFSKTFCGVSPLDKITIQCLGLCLSLHPNGKYV